LQSQFTYFLILAVSLAGPLALSFDKKVAFYTKWKFLFPAMILPATFYIVWDSYFTSKGVWGFNPAYITGINYAGLPIEEVLFFFVVPYCCVFIYECIRVYFPKLNNGLTSNVFLRLLAGCLLVAGGLYYKKDYTAYTFVFFAVFVFIYYVFRNYFSSFRVSAFLVAYAIILVPFLLVNGFLTAIPVVLYNNAENLGIRIYTIPLEDVFYGMLLIFMNIVLFEKLRSSRN
jgi:lycopene cyclase domain-containing protein